MDYKFWLPFVVSLLSVYLTLKQVRLQQPGGSSSPRGSTVSRVKQYWPTIAAAALVLLVWAPYVYTHHVQNPAKYALDQKNWSANYKKEEVVGKSFKGERIVIDGHSYVNCTFENVTLVFNGTAPFDLISNTFSPPIIITSDNPAIVAAMREIMELKTAEERNHKDKLK